MSYPKNAVAHYRNFQGINEKASEYTTTNAQALNLRNIDFYVPNAWGKTPGSTQAITNGTSGTIRSLFEFEKLSGESWIISSSNNEVLISNGTTGWSSISSGWTNGQAEDSLAFVDKAWIANGQKFISYDGTSAIPYGMTAQTVNLDNGIVNSGLSFITVFGETQTTYSDATTGTRSILLGFYANIRSDGYLSPVAIGSFLGPLGAEIQPEPLTPFTVNSGNWQGPTSGNYGQNVTIIVDGFTAPSNQGIVGHALFLALDQFTGLTSGFKTTAIKSSALSYGGGNWLSTADLSQFYLYATYAAGVTRAFINGETDSWDTLTATMTSFSLMQQNFFASYVPKYIELNNNRLFSAGYSATPSTVWFSDTAEPEVVQPESFFEVRTNDSDKVTGLKQYQNQLLVFKERSFHKLIGTQESNFQLVEISTEYGCLSNKAIVEFDDRLMFLDRDGIVEYNGASWRIMSTPIEDTMRTLNISAAKEKAVSVHYKERNQVWFGIPVNGSSENNLTVVYDYLLNAWTFIEGFNPSSFAIIKQGLTKQTVYYGNYSGSVNYMSPSFFSYNGTAFTCTIETGFDAPDGQDVTNIFRRLFLDVNTQSGVTGAIDCEVFKDYNRSSVQATFTIFQNQFQTKKEFGVPAKSVAFKMSHANASLPLLINGYDVQRRYLRKL